MEGITDTGGQVSKFNKRFQNLGIKAPVAKAAPAKVEAKPKADAKPEAKPEAKAEAKPAKK